MNIKNEDKKKIEKVINKFSKVYSEMEEIEAELKTLESRRIKVIDEIKNIREDERIILEEMKEKYGEVTLNLESMEIVK
jgi:septation ring formation regulator EzrA